MSPKPDPEANFYFFFANPQKLSAKYLFPFAFDPFAGL
jgi:hypothetical protein